MHPYLAFPKPYRRNPLSAVGAPYGGRAGGSSPFSPLSAFTGGKKGLWWDESDITTGFQDSAGTTPQTATGQPTGKRTDKSGNGNNFLQATAAARPIYTVAGAQSADVLDGVDDGGATGAVAAGTFTSTMDVFLTLKRVSVTAVPIYGDGTAKGVGIWNSGDGTRPDVGAGTPTYFVDGVSITATRGALFTALTTGANHVLQINGADLSTWTLLGIGNWSGGGFITQADILQLIVCESQPALRANLLTFAGAKGGLSL